LLRGVVTGDAAILRGISSVAASGADLTVLWSILPRDGSAVGVRPLAAGDLATAFARHGLDVRELRQASLDEIHATRSSWAKRLGAGTTRPVTLLRATRR
jgi:16S rRNA (adenine(1408)-N(1))-methyltransferase